ncbi:MAG: hemerythrin domain-containing protein [candidate division KSB1 bacterium]|nr:hemerythrin domain-containing protein [candidate division KSB1 bacterium]
MPHPRPIGVLMEEHELIKRVLAVLRRACAQVEQGGKVPPELFLQAGEFIRGFADRCHHAKEENLLFQRMVQRGMPQQGGPIGQMLLEHEQGRAFAQDMMRAAQAWRAGEEKARQEVLKKALSYADLLDQHIFKEDKILYPMGEKLLAEGDWVVLEREFERVEEEVTGAGEHERYLRLVEDLERRTREETRR